MPRFSTPSAVGPTLRLERSWKDPWLVGRGFVAETVPEVLTNLTNVAIASGNTRLQGGIVVPKGEAVTGVTVKSGGTAGSALTHSWAALIRVSDRAYLRSSADDTTATLAANTRKRFALSTPWTALVDTPIWVAICFAQSGGAVPNFVGSQDNATNAGVSPLLCALGDSGLTTPPADGTIHGVPSSNSNALWVALD